MEQQNTPSHPDGKYGLLYFRDGYQHHYSAGSQKFYLIKQLN
jgi:hypothetical protein